MSMTEDEAQKATAAEIREKLLRWQTERLALIEVYDAKRWALNRAGRDLGTAEDNIAWYERRLAEAEAREAGR